MCTFPQLTHKQMLCNRPNEHIFSTSGKEHQDQLASAAAHLGSQAHNLGTYQARHGGATRDVRLGQREHEEMRKRGRGGAITARSAATRQRAMNYADHCALAAQVRSRPRGGHRRCAPWVASGGSRLPPMRAVSTAELSSCSPGAHSWREQLRREVCLACSLIFPSLT